MKASHLRVVFACLAAAFAVASILLLVSLRREQEHSVVLARKGADLCLRTKERLEAVVKQPLPTDQLSAMARFHFLEPNLCRFCLGTATPIDDAVARACWLAKGSDECYRDVFTDLLKLYKEREHDWSFAASP